MIKYVIPARKGSKGLAGKNRLLFDYTKSIIPREASSSVYVTTDDDVISYMASCFNVHTRDEKLSDDNASMKDVLLDVLTGIDDTDIIVMLYLTYPERTWADVTRALHLFFYEGAKSLLCKKDVVTNPYLCMMEKGLCGEQVIEHNLYRRQDYRKCFEISHFIFIAQAQEIQLLNNNLYNDETMFMHIDNKIDVDTFEDYNKFKEMK